MLKLDWGDAQIWMEIAEMLYLHNVKNSKEFPHKLTGYPRGNELNVSAVCAGYAFELIFKVLAKVGNNQPKSKHDSSAAYKHLAPEDKVRVDRIIVNHGWSNSTEFLEYLDKNFCHGDRKYWMRPPSGGKAKVVFNFGGRKGMDALKKLHKELSELAIKRINENQEVFEYWPGTDQHI
ncbi:MAG: hypothetical protein OXC42_03000 [Gammaproteobacteria bacterium]|nr:hypothetical protein [Gammaproteobacteria bacterium]